MMKKWIALILCFALILSLAACGTGTGETPADSTPANSETASSAENDKPDTGAEENTVEAPGSGPADASNITSVEGVPLITLNNGVQMPQFGLGTQIQSLVNTSIWFTCITPRVT